MNEAVQSLTESSRHLLSAIRSGGQDQLLPDLTRSRHEAIGELSAALQRGVLLSSEEVQEIQHLDRDLIAALAHRQKQIGAELALHQRGRRAGMAYRNQSDGVPRYVDRSS